MSYYDIILQYDWETTRRKIYASTEADVERALSHDRPSMDDFAALVSPAADKYLNEMAAKSYRITRRRFGNTMQLYIPLYLANICQNHCVYCGFNCTNKIHRAILTPDEIHAECQAIKKDPFEHILLVTGEAPRSSSVQYMADSMEIVKQYFQQISLEVQPLETDEYRMLMDHGLHSVYVYQETYNRERYPVYHLRGRKADYRYRLETPDRLCEAGVYKVGVGNLIGLEDWRTEAFFTALHVRYLENRYWRQKYSIAFPRLRPYFGEDGFNPEHPTTERNLLQLICAYRLLGEVPAQLLPQILSTFNTMALEVCEGQQYDMDFERKPKVSVVEYMHMIELKTSVLLAGATTIGALLGGASEEDCRKLRRFAIELGLAFQLQDDLLDSYGDERLGKAIGGDILEGKQTYLMITAISRADEPTREVLRSTHRSQMPDAEKIATIKAVYDRLDIPRLTEQQISLRFERALSILDTLSADKARTQRIREYAESLIGRKN